MIRNQALEDQGRVRAVETGTPRNVTHTLGRKTKPRSCHLPFAFFVNVWLTGGCPHAAIREDISANMHALEELQEIYDTELLFVESGGDNLAGMSL